MLSFLKVLYSTPDLDLLCAYLILSLEKLLRLRVSLLIRSLQSKQFVQYSPKPAFITLLSNWLPPFNLFSLLLDMSLVTLLTIIMATPKDEILLKTKNIVCNALSFSNGLREDIRGVNESRIKISVFWPLKITNFCDLHFKLVAIFE